MCKFNMEKYNFCTATEKKSVTSPCCAISYMNMIFNKYTVLMAVCFFVMSLLTGFVINSSVLFNLIIVFILLTTIIGLAVKSDKTLS